MDKHYGQGVDVWSCGCILAEILNRVPLLPGRSHTHQLQIILRILGTPSGEELDFLEASAKRVVLDMGAFPKRPLRLTFPNASALAVDLLEKMLAFDPRQRISVSVRAARGKVQRGGR